MENQPLFFSINHPENKFKLKSETKISELN